MFPPNNNRRTARCATVLRIIDRHGFEVDQLLPLLEAVVGEWKQDEPEDRPDFDCLNKVWLRGRRQVASGLASAHDVAEVLHLLVIQGGIDPFHGLTPENAREHLLTSPHEPSVLLRGLLRRHQLIVEGHAEEAQRLVRAIGLGFGWDDALPMGGALSVMADEADLAHLLEGYRLATSLASHHGQQGLGSGTAQDVVERIVDRLRQRLRGNALAGHDSESARRAIGIHELGRVVRGMVLLLSPAVQLDESQHAMIRAWFSPQNNREDSPLGHLRAYALRGTPLMDLVGDDVDGQVRRAIARVMEDGAADIAGFPTDARLSHRPSDLLRRIRFLVRAMVLRSRVPGAHPNYIDFVHGLFAGAGQDLVLSAARFAFERPSPGQAPAQGIQQIRADLQNNVRAHAGTLGANTAGVGLDCIEALRTVVSIEIDTWTADAQADEGNGPELLSAVLGELDELQVRHRVADDQLVRRVFDAHLLARAVEEHRRLPSGTEPRRQFFGSLQNRLAGTVQVLRSAVLESPAAFESVVRSQFHREFDDEVDGRIGLWRLVRGSDLFVAEQGGLLGGSARAQSADACKTFLQIWAGISAADEEKPLDRECDGWDANTWVHRIRDEPLVTGGPVRAPWIFRAADYAARGSQAALLALRDLTKVDNARQLFQMASRDAVGRSLGVVIAQTCSAELIQRLFGTERGFALDFSPSVDGVTPLMAAARFATKDSLDRQLGFEEVYRCFMQHGGNVQARDARGWRAIHHAFAAGHVGAARFLCEQDPGSPLVVPRDSTTFLIEALRRTAAAHHEGASVMGLARDLLAAMTHDDRVAVFGFEGARMIHSTVEGMPLSVVSASMDIDGGDGNWPELMSLVEAYPEAAAVILTRSGSGALRRLVSREDHLQLAQFLRCVSAAGAQHVEAVARGLPEPLAVLVCSQAGYKHRIDSSLMQLVHLWRFNELDVAARAPAGGSIFHELVRSASDARGFQQAASGAQLYNLACTLLGWATPQIAGAAVRMHDYDGESAIWQAVRWGEWALALAYARGLGPAGANRLQAAAKFITDPDDYQGGVDNDLRIQIRGRRIEMVLEADGQRFDVCGPFKDVEEANLPTDLDNGSAQEWLRRNAASIARQLRAQLGTQLNVGADEFINLIAHLVDADH